jgi:hypothetical protein
MNPEIEVAWLELENKIIEASKHGLRVDYE